MDDMIKEIMEKVKVSAAAFGEAAESTVKSAGKWTEDTVESAKLNMQVFDLNTEISILYREIGKIVYDTHTGENATVGSLEAKIKELDEKNAQIREIKDKIALQKKSRSCPSCGEPCAKEDKFCKSCGARLN